MVKVLAVGAGRCLARSVNTLLRLEELNDCRVVAVVSEDKYSSTIYGWNYAPKVEIGKIDFDCVYIAVVDEVDDVKRELYDMGILTDDIVPFEALFIPKFSFTKYIEMKKQHVSIIANMCWGGVTYHYFHLPFLSPFINMFILDDDYLDLLRNLKSYVDGDLEFSRMETERFMKIQYPVFRLNNGTFAGGVYLHMNHYNDKSIASEKWEQRKGRINWDNLLVMMYTENHDVAEEFDSMPFRKKICLTNFASNLPSVCYLDIFSHQPLLGLPSWQIVSGLAAGRYVFYDPWEILLNGNHTARWCKG